MNVHGIHLKVVQTPHLKEARRREPRWPTVAVLVGIGAILLAMANMSSLDPRWVCSGRNCDLAVLGIGAILALAGLVRWWKAGS